MPDICCIIGVSCNKVGSYKYVLDENGRPDQPEVSSCRYLGRRPGLAGLLIRPSSITQVKKLWDTG